MPYACMSFWRTDTTLIPGPRTKFDMKGSRKAHPTRDWTNWAAVTTELVSHSLSDLDAGFGQHCFNTFLVSGERIQGDEG